ncbi:Hypothetical protein SMAX5B_002695 [Scophthalmus maximus]|uniref:Uncharacterized protein n=1 Tax=Scophthalmus maximus TaxID=52904 RepID=A0A2U9C2A5_SCOMX|nr:Hypothetical protein SMAX5B_002695 [Scophthalmus maximus]
MPQLFPCRVQSGPAGGSSRGSWSSSVSGLSRLLLTDLTFYTSRTASLSSFSPDLISAPSLSSDTHTKAKLHFNHSGLCQLNNTGHP